MRSLFCSFILYTMLMIVSLGQLVAQVTLRGKVLDETTGEPVIGANVFIQATSIGTITDYEGEFNLKTEMNFPFTLQVSFVGYAARTIEINDASASIRVRLSAAILLEESVIVGEKVTNAQRESPISIASMDLIDIREIASIGFYEGSANLKEVDLTTPALGFKIINTRGFNSTSPIRTLQLIDGMDNQAPGLNFSLGNFLGVSELDILKMDIIAGATGAYYGPAAFNGVISMQTRNPFIHQGLSAMARIGERNLFEGAIRYAHVVKDKRGKDVFAYKINLMGLRADDWEADNEEPTTDSKVLHTNPGRYDAVNMYGDEYDAQNDYRDPSGRDLYLYPGLDIFYRSGYKETDLVDYNTENLKANLALHFRTAPSLNIESPSVIFSSAYGTGTTVYQGDNRFSLRGINFLQNRIEFSKPDKFFIRAYHTYENAGKSYDPYFTALRLQDLCKTDDRWNKDYTNFWFIDGKIPDRMRALGYPKLEGVYPNITFDFDAARQWLIEYADSLSYWHSLALAFSDGITEDDPEGTLAFLQPGTAAFDSAFQMITGQLNTNSGTRFSDRSSLFHVGGEYRFTPLFVDELRIGASFRLYNPMSEGTIFSDTAGTQIQTHEIGMYAGIKKKFFNQKLTANATLRLDKTKQLNWIYTPAASLIFEAWTGTYLRASYSSAVRNPTLTEKYLYLNVGPAILSGHIERVDSLIEVNSFKEYLNTGSADNLDYFSIDPIRPEKVQTYEFGIRTTIHKDLYADINYYHNSYRDFLGYLIGLTADINTDAPIASFKNFQAYRYSANTGNKVTTNGFSVGLNYYLSPHISLSGNYSYNALQKTVEEDPIIPAYNTPKHKFNLGVSGRDIRISNSSFFRRMGFNVQYKWIDGFRFEGSPQFSGDIPEYGLLDAQVNVHVDRIKTTFKIGASNVLNNRHYETYGGPKVGRHAYVSVAYNF